jgi:hypothetical protein
MLVTLSRVFVCLRVCKSRFMYVYGSLNWFPIRGSCLSLFLIGDHI